MHSIHGSSVVLICIMIFVPLFIGFLIMPTTKVPQKGSTLGTIGLIIMVIFLFKMQFQYHWTLCDCEKSSPTSITVGSDINGKRLRH